MHTNMRPSPDSSKLTYINLNTKKTTLNKKIFTHNTPHFIFYLIYCIMYNFDLNARSLKRRYSSLTTKYTQFQNKPATPVNIYFSYKVLPIKKKKIMFLRAPYKNKLARLSVMNLQSRIIFVFKRSKLKRDDMYAPTVSSLPPNYLNLFKKFNLSFSKLKHETTRIQLVVTNSNNFTLKHYLNNS